MVFGMGMGMGAGETGAVETGAVEAGEQRVDLLEVVRALQEETGGFAAFAPVAAATGNGRQLDSVTAVERLKMLAVARMFLDNIENIQADGVASGIDGLKVLQTALRFGANDVGAVDAGLGRSEEDLRRIIRDAGLRPAERDAAYRAMMIA
jgi:cyclic dehypoxanthinyl futalosine synthase